MIHPDYYRIIWREGTTWSWHSGKVFCGSSNTPLANMEARHGLTRQAVTIALFRLHGGRSGYYLANLKNKQYYYCGLTMEDVKAKLLSLGIGRVDPMDG